MAKIKCPTCNLEIKVESLLTNRCPRCGNELPSNCFGCSGNCLSCLAVSHQEKEKSKK